MNMKWIFGLLVLIVGLSACEGYQNNSNANKNDKVMIPGPVGSAYSDYIFPFFLQKPSKQIELPKELKEISGLSLHQSGNFLLANHDEKGIIFFLNPENGEIQKELDLKIKGDFEGIEMVDDIIYMVKSNGELFSNKILEKEELEITPYETGLKKKADVEGLAYLEIRNMLILACKGKSGKKSEKNFYGFDIEAGSLLPLPLITVSEDDIKNFLAKYTKLQEDEIKKISKDFSPSGIAIHPITGDWYILSSVGKLLFVLAPTGDILYIEKLDPNMYLQPEGIVFSKDGTQLYISSEAKDQTASLFILK